MVFDAVNSYWHLIWIVPKFKRRIQMQTWISYYMWFDETIIALSWGYELKIITVLDNRSRSIIDCEDNFFNFLYFRTVLFLYILWYFVWSEIFNVYIIAVNCLPKSVTSLVGFKGNGLNYMEKYVGTDVQ